MVHLYMKSARAFRSRQTICLTGRPRARARGTRLAAYPAISFVLILTRPFTGVV